MKGLSNEIADNFRDLPTSYDIWKKLEETYRLGFSVKITAENEIRAPRKEQRVSIVEHIRSFNNLHAEVDLHRPFEVE